LAKIDTDPFSDCEFVKNLYQNKLGVTVTY
jgi:hypothetical protein